MNSSYYLSVQSIITGAIVIFGLQKMREKSANQAYRGNPSSSKAVKLCLSFFLVILFGFAANTYAQSVDNSNKEEAVDAQNSEKPVAKTPPEITKSKDKPLPKLPRIETKPCAFLEKYPTYHADCGTLYVKENPNAVNSKEKPARVTTIPFMVFQPEGEVSSEPLVITGGGGPGASIYIIDDFDGDPAMFYTGLENSTLKSGRPLIVMEMRGSGLSVANLDCPAITELEIELLSTYPFKKDTKKYLNTISKCASRKKSSGIDANFYNTDYAIQDIDDLRQLLGFEKWHLLGISHGTRVSLRYAQRYPEHTASLVLDSIYPFEVDSYVDMPEFSANIFTQPFALCDADPRCKLESGEASVTLLESFMAKINLDPPTLEVEYYDENWTIGQKKIKISPELIAYVLFNNSYQTEAILEFPQLIKDALNEDYTKLSKLISETIDLLNYTWFAEGAYASYACYEEIPFSNYTLALQNAVKYQSFYWSELDTIKLDQQLCKIWNIKPSENNPKNFDHSQLTLPVLILAGALDPFTPAIWAVDFQAKLPLRNKTQHLRIWPLKSHNLAYDDTCVELVVSSFLDDPAQTIDNDCALKDISEVSFSNADESTTSIE
jgi:pimeloyl-ACP methyl ester carboxylesterase